MLNILKKWSTKTLIKYVLSTKHIFQFLDELSRKETQTTDELTQNQILLIETLNKVAKSSSKLAKTRQLLATNQSESPRVYLTLSADQNLQNNITATENVSFLITDIYI